MYADIGTLLCGILCIGGTIFAVVGVIVLMLVNHNRSRGKTAPNPNWPTVTGRITTTRVEETVRTRPDDDVFFYPYIEFEYMINGQIYKGKQAVGKPFNLESKARSTIAQYPHGTSVNLYYNPEKHEEAKLLLR